MPNIDWNASDYQKHFSFVPSYGESVMELLTKPEGAFVVDLGCGNGMLTKKLAEKGYHVLGVDDSETMLRLAEKNCSGISFQKGNAVDFSLKPKADAIFSNAVLHWIDAKDQQKMLDNICHQLVLGGEFVCEFGGYGCAEQVHSTLEKCFAAHGMTYPRVFYFPTIGTYAPMLEQAGFRVEYASLFDRPTVQEGRDGLADWISMFVSWYGRFSEKRNYLGNDRETAGYTLAGGSLVRRLCTDTVSSSTGEIVMVLPVIHIVWIKRTEKER